MTDIEISEVVIAKIIAPLIEWGIQDPQMSFDELEPDPEKFGSFFSPCINRLAREGIIRTGSVRREVSGSASGIVSRPVSTSFGFSPLGRQRQLRDAERSLSEPVQTDSHCAEDYSNAGRFTGGLLGSFARSIGS